MLKTHKRLPTRIKLVIGAHFILGLTMAVVAYTNSDFDWPYWTQIWFLGLVSSEVLLLGIWAGFASASWFRKLITLIAGICWMVILSLSAEPDWSDDGERISSAFIVTEILVTLTMVIAGTCMCCRRWFAKLVQRESWQLSPLSG